MNHKKLSSLQMGIEAYTLAREYIFKPNQYKIFIEKNRGNAEHDVNETFGEIRSDSTWKASDLYLFLDELHTPEEDRDVEKFSKAMEDDTENTQRGKVKTQASEKIRKRYEPYLREFSKKYEVPISFQEKFLDGSFEENPVRLIKISMDYLHEFAHSYSPESLELVVRNWTPMPDILYFFICIRYAIRRKVRIEFEYQSTMKMKWTNRRVIPLLISNIENKLSLIAVDLTDKETKSFPISRIKNLKSNIEQILAAYPDKELSEFNFNNYRKNDPGATFQEPRITYKIELSEANLNLLKHSKTLNYRELDECATNPHWKVIEVTTHRERDLFDLLFNYGTYARLLSPPESVEKFKEKVSAIRKFYQ